ncbi:MAG: family 20 glycosylhydrolase [Bacteroidales bacterium]|nr:family 20 glycosylhydrolase [Bacteroidales bacterium]
MKIRIVERFTAGALLVAMLPLLNSCSDRAAPVKHEPLSVIPIPAVMEPGEGEFVLSAETGIYIDPSFESSGSVTEMLNGFLESHYGDLRVSTLQELRDGNIIAVMHDTLPDSHEAYNLDVAGKAITIVAGDDAGLFYAFQTLMQLFWPSQEAVRGRIAIPCVKISDRPRFQWRGMHLDVSRHFFPKEFIFKMLDAMAMHKLNTFHWHLTDDQGWRIEIKKFPELTAVGGWRDETLIGHGSETPWVYDGTRYGGYYTHDDVREVVEYARRLHINVLPEIEMPGHAVAALQAYPGLSCSGQPVPPFNRWGVSEDVFCAGKEETFELLTGVLEEVAGLFPYEYIHIGGDECPKVRWESCPDCQKRIAGNNLKDEHELQSYFVKRIESFLTSRGKKIIGWDEILEGGIADNAAVMSWRGHAGGIQAANMGHDVVMTPHSFVYLDYYQSEYNEPLSIGGMLPMEKVYSIDIMPPEIAEEKRKHIIGAQTNLWTEYIADEKHAEYMIFPRLAALAEALWTPLERLDYDDFTQRMAAHYARYDAMNINYRVPYPTGYEAVNLVTDGSVTVELSNGIPGTSICYTTDGSEPDEKSKLYKEPLTLEPDTEIILKSVTVMPGGRKSAVMTGVFRKVELKEALQIDRSKLGQGLRFSLYRGEFDSVEDPGAKADSAGIISTVRIPAGAPAGNFGLVMTGYILVPADGVYAFFTGSDDGVRVSVDGELIVDGEELHHGITNEGRAALSKGLHHFTVRYFQRLYRQSLGVSWEGPATARESVPPEVLFHEMN